MLRVIVAIGTGLINRIVAEGVSGCVGFLNSGPQSPQQDLQAGPLNGGGES